ncbi:MAG: hypothetical protein V3V32_04365 [Dehalococcoidia bacterium]
MKIVDFPFMLIFRKDMLAGRKQCTSRTKSYGKPLDEFLVFGARFRITAIETRRLEDVASFLWRKEGCDSPGQFKNIWASLHPGRGYDPNWRVRVHHFRLLQPEEYQKALL